MKVSGRLPPAAKGARAWRQLISTTGPAPCPAAFLAEAGRTEEAVAVLEAHAPFNSGRLADHIINLGRIKDAVALLLDRDDVTVKNA